MKIMFQLIQKSHLTFSKRLRSSLHANDTSAYLFESFFFNSTLKRGLNKVYELKKVRS